MKNDIKEVLVSEKELEKICKRLGEQITKDYAGKKLMAIGLLKGSFIFMADLLRKVDIQCSIDFMAVSSYGSGTRSSGAVKIVKDLTVNPEGYDLLIIEDILDSGRTLSYVCDLLNTRKPNSIKVCTLLDKPSRRVNSLVADYVGMEVPDEFVVGYGLDYDEKYRNLPYIGVLKEEVYS